MRRGEIVEDGPSAESSPGRSMPYTAALIAAIPDIDPDRPIDGAPDLPTQQESAE